MLKVWIPGTSDTTDQGLNNLQWVNDNVTIVDGKLGKSLSFNGSSSRLSVTNFQLTNKWSIALWAKCTSASSGWMGIVTLGDTGDSNIQMGIFMNPSANKMQVSFNGKYNASLSMQNQTEWNHFCATYDGQNMLFYVNGNYVSTTAANYTLLTKQHLTIGAESNNATSGGHTAIRIPFNGQLNDVRIFDNQILSAKEIEVLARGLVLHYPLDREGFGQDNLLKSTPKGTDPTAYQFCSLNLASNLQANKTYTLQLWDVDISHSAKTASQIGVSTYWGGGSVSLCGWIGTDYFTNGHADYLVKTFTVTEANANHSQAVNAWLNFYNSVPNASGTRNGTIGRWKLEEGDKATPWTPAPTDDLYSGMGLDSNIVYDATGYKRNGTANGVTYSGDTAKYLTSTSFDGIDDGVTITNLNIANILNDKCTISFWIKPNGDNGGRSVYFSAYNQVSWSIEKTAGNKLRSYWNGTPDKAINEITISDGTWQHIAITKNGTSSIKFYYNGEFKKELTDAHNALTFGTTWRLGRDTRSNDGTPYKGLMSDFRIYATALSAEAIAELYHTGASLADNGTLMTSQYVEV